MIDFFYILFWFFVIACLVVIILTIDWLIGHFISIYAYITLNYDRYVKNLGRSTIAEYFDYSDVYHNYKNWFPTRYLNPKFYLLRIFAFIHKRKHPEDYI